MIPTLQCVAAVGLTTTVFFLLKLRGAEIQWKIAYILAAIDSAAFGLPALALLVAGHLSRFGF